ncbi:MAG: efflux RND transporter periplasmic adaptor subunit, partial [Acidobacteriota bacterium]
MKPDRDTSGGGPSRGSRKRLLAAGALVAVVLVLAAILLRRPSGTSVETARAARRGLVVPILSDGTLEPPPGGEARSPDAATVAAILVKDGDRVRRSQELVRLENPELSGSAGTARAAELELAAERARTEADLADAKRQAEHLRRVAESNRRLLAQSAIAAAAVEDAELAARQAEDRVRGVEARLASLSGGKEGRSRVAIADESARELERRAAALVVRAPFDGVVYGLPRKTGEPVVAGQIVASVADPQHVRIRVRVDEPDLPRVAAGQRLLVTFDGLPERRWEGHVVEVPSGVREVGGRQVGEIVGEIGDPGSKLPPNASVNVQIVAGEKASALVIPRAALMRDGERRYVWLLENGRAKPRDVSTGLVGLNEVEITRGLSEGDTVILP